MTGRQLVYLGDREFRLDELAAAPEPGPGEAVVAVAATGICGSDVHGYAGLNDRRPPGTVMGHETAGRVVSVGAGPSAGPAPGTPVALWPIDACGACDRCAAASPHLCRSRRLYGCVPELPGGFADLLVARVENLVPLAHGMPVEWGALVEPLAVGEHALTLVDLEPGATVVVIGGGAIGIAAALAAMRRDVDEVVVVEPLEHRRATLAALGLTAVHPGEAPGDAALAIECVGIEATVRSAVAATRPGGCVLCVGLAAAEVSVPMVGLVIEERRMVGSSAYTRADFEAVAAAVASGAVDLQPMIERRVAVDELPGAFARYADGRETAVRTLMVT